MWIKTNNGQFYKHDHKILKQSEIYSKSLIMEEESYKNKLYHPLKAWGALIDEVHLLEIIRYIKYRYLNMKRTYMYLQDLWSNFHFVRFAWLQ